MVSKLQLKSSVLRLLPGKGEYEFAFQFWYYEPSLKNQCGDRKGLMLLFWSALIVDGRVVRLGRWERWESGEIEKVGKVGGWSGWEDRRVVGDAEWVQNFIFLFLMLIKGTKRQDGIATGIACSFLRDSSWEIQMRKNGVTI